MKLILAKVNVERTVAYGGLDFLSDAESCSRLSGIAFALDDSLIPQFGDPN